MDLARLSETDLFGRFFLKLPGNVPFDNYYRSLYALLPLLTSKEWNECVTGYYINVAGNMDAVRLSYFTCDSDRIQKCTKSFCSKNNIIAPQRSELPHRTKIAGIYGKEETRYRKYLYLYSLIGFDIIQADLLNARCLIATFRYQVMASRQEYKPHFENTFKKQSPIYNSLSQNQKQQFWRDLSHWPNGSQIDWAHMMVNMILPGDFLHVWDYFRSPKAPKSRNKINKIVRNLGFQIPNSWRPL